MPCEFYRPRLTRTQDSIFIGERLVSLNPLGFDAPAIGKRNDTGQVIIGPFEQTYVSFSHNPS